MMKGVQVVYTLFMVLSLSAFPLSKVTGGVSPNPVAVVAFVALAMTLEFIATFGTLSLALKCVC
jgi:hypothetical protein